MVRSLDLMAATDGTLVLGTLEGDRSAFAELYDRYARLVRAICFDSAGDYDTAADLAQEVFLRAFEKLGALRDPQRFGPWLIGIARRTCLEWQRGSIREWRHRDGCPVSEDWPGPAPEGDDTLTALRDAIVLLSEKDRLALHVCYVDGLGTEKARNVLGLSRSGFFRAVSVARQRLKAILTREAIR
jgi:RNA polymerase sigma-70 factor (ECF subfamily)